MLHLGYESTAVVYGRSSLKVMDFGKTCSYELRMWGLVTTGSESTAVDYGCSSLEVLTRGVKPSTFQLLTYHVKENFLVRKITLDICWIFPSSSRLKNFIFNAISKIFGLH